ncbi:MAG: DotU family type IV/VI secretion system protein [Phycisphaerales bacterium]|nr:DotU family type IV/VI secretion system protein [Phycisphaerales bacterium]
MATDQLLSKACWPVFAATIQVARQVRAGQELRPESVRAQILAAFREAEDTVRADGDAERAWIERIRAMMTYFVDRRMVHLEWPGRHYWLEHRLETSKDGLAHPQALGGNLFFRDCNELRQLHDTASRMKRDDAPLLAEQLGLYYTCMRLGFAGELEAEALEDYARQIYLMLPGQRDLRDDRLFPESYAHTVDRPAQYDLHTPLVLVLSVFAVLLIGSVVAYQIAWRSATGAIQTAAQTWDQAAAEAAR